MSDQPQQSRFLIYQAENGVIKIDVRFEEETVWLTQQYMAELFQTTQQNISLHLQNIYKEGELTQEATHKEFLSVRQEGARQVNRTIDFYNLDAILSVGYRIKSVIATRFRIWATQRLREAKNYLNEEELAVLNNLVEQYLVFAEGQAMRRIPMRMVDWVVKLDGFLQLNERDILTHAGHLSHDAAATHAENESDAFHRQRLAEQAQQPDDFDQVMQHLPEAQPVCKKKGGQP